MERLIIASNPDSFPMGLKEIVITTLHQIPFNELQELNQTVPKHERDTDRLLENCLGIWKQYDLYHKTLIPLFNQYDLLCYHATRVSSENAILLNGLRTGMQFYLETLRTFLRAEGVSSQNAELAVDAIRQEYQRKYRDNSHQLCFFTSLASFHNDDGIAGYDQFCETVGGELANWALESKYPDILKILQTKGVPVVVEFSSPFSLVADYHKDNLIFPFVAHVAAQELWGINYVIKADSSLICEIPPDRILRLIDPDTI